MTFACEKGFGKVFCDQCGCEVGPSEEMAVLNCSSPSGDSGTPAAAMEELGQFCFGFVPADDGVHTWRGPFLFCGCWTSSSCSRDWYVP